MGFGQLEVPQVFRLGGRWHCLFCTAADHWSEAYIRQAPQAPVTGSHHLVADDPRGPWTIAPGPFLDGALPCRRYAARMVETGSGPMLIGFADGGRGFQLHRADAECRAIPKKRVPRNRFLRFMSRNAPCKIAEEVLGGAHFRGRDLSGTGHDIRLLPPRNATLP
ncbi:glycoside hydrolase family protein [Mangrovicoccus ximenensis]|uniref:hypothetical protein n=1 Tax=Mangrovicoccus ximenensis TaxID=1911570 RepID=UPI00191BD189|nr:hypothetical protein [Mangrovicoccus ximenensis]